MHFKSRIVQLAPQHPGDAAITRAAAIVKAGALDAFLFSNRRVVHVQPAGNDGAVRTGENVSFQLGDAIESQHV